MSRIIFTVTNDLSYDQRMNRICSSLAAQGYEVSLIGRKRPHSLPLKNEKYQQHRLNCWFEKGKSFYIEYNIRLFFYLLTRKMNVVCAIDLDTILPCLFVSRIRNVKRIYDAHELFTELKEVVTRPAIRKMWTRVEQYAVPKFQLGYTVSESIAAEFRRRYQVHYQSIRNMSRLRPLTGSRNAERFILYSGAVNEARAFEYLIPAMKKVDCRLVICGDGNYMPQLKELIRIHQVENKIELKGMLTPESLWQISQQAYIGVAIAEKEGLNQYFALPNKFFDYLHAGLPQVTMNFPEYLALNKQFQVAVLIDGVDPDLIATAINNLLVDTVMYANLRDNCLRARLELNWEKEEKKIIDFYQSVVSS